LVFLANGILELEADMVRNENNYELDIEGQQQTFAFYRGHNPTIDNVIGQFTYKNTGGYCDAAKVKNFTPRQLT
jgi:hypothetical protein